MLYDFRVPIGWRELAVRTYKDTVKDNGFGLAAQLAYYFFLSLFPALLFLLAVASYLPQEDLVDRVVAAMQGAAPQAVIEIIQDQLSQIADQHQGGLLTFGVVAALWSSSVALVAIINTLNKAYDVAEARTWWRQRLTALFLTMGLATFTVISFGLIVTGPALGRWIGGYLGLGEAFALAWYVMEWPVVFVMIATAFGLVYHFAPNRQQPYVWLTPGSLLATLLWIAGSMGFRVYVANFGSYNESYGAIGGVMVLLLWLYLSGLVLILGAELNSEIAHAREHAAADAQPPTPAAAPAPGRRES